MKYYYCLMLLLSICGPGIAQNSPSKGDIIYWSENKRLAFSDFKGVPKKQDTTLTRVSDEVMTHKLGGIVKAIDIQFLTTGEKTKFTIRAAMMRSSSWIKDPQDSIQLNHEQGHFDICEVYARRLRRDIAKAASLAAARSVYEKTLLDEEVFHDAYDQENKYQSGGISAAWKEKIAARLKELEAYKVPTVTVAAK